MKQKRIKIVILAAIMVFTVSFFKQYFLLMPNRSESLPQHLFLVTKGKIPTRKDQYFVAYVPDNHYYRKDRPFIKMVGGLPNDEIKISGREFYINDQFIAFAKFHSLKGEPLERADIAGLIPPHHFFAYTPHKDSYDSRYKEIGLINENNIIGTATPLF